MPKSAIERLPVDRRNISLQRISHRARRLRGAGTGGGLARVGRNDALEQLTVRLGVIPVLWLPNEGVQNPNRTYLQAMSPRRATGEKVTLTGPTTAQDFVPGDPARDCQFSTPGSNQAVTATDSYDANATGRGLADIPA